MSLLCTLWRIMASRCASFACWRLFASCCERRKKVPMLHQEISSTGKAFTLTQNSDAINHHILLRKRSNSYGPIGLVRGVPDMLARRQQAQVDLLVRFCRCINGNRRKLMHHVGQIQSK